MRNIIKTLPNISNVVLAIGLSVTASAVFAHGDSHSTTPSVDLSDVVPIVQPVLADIVRAAPVPDINLSIGGQWSAVHDWPVVAIHAALLPNGKVLAWDATPDDSDDDPHTIDNKTTRVTLWDPVTDTHTGTNNETDGDLFCAGSAHLWDGRILFAGGDSGDAGSNGPLANSNIYNPVTNTWHRTEDMNAPRWYSSVAALSNGEMITLGGTYNPTPLAEVFQFDQTWRVLSGTIPEILNEDYQWLQQTPEGSVLYFGPSDVLVDIDTADDGTFTARATRDSIEARDYGSYAMYDVGKILVAGGEEGLSSAVVIDTATRQTVDTSPMNFGRRQHNLTILADGSVLATGGNSDGEIYYSPTGGVYRPEIWHPDTGIWTVQNTMPSDRQYHSIAMLLPDGQVLSAGGGICGDCYALNYEERNGEIFTPPYLFNDDGSRATRPQIFSVPEVADYAEQLTASLNSSVDILKAHLIKLGSVTHSENQDQRLVPLSFTQAGDRIVLAAPESRHVAPPGHYLLFVVDTEGVPSEGAVIKIGQPLIGEEQLTKSTLELNTWDTYLTEPVVGKATIAVSAVSGTTLYVSAVSPVKSAQQSDVICTAVVSSTGSASCNVEAATGSQLHISLNGGARSDYSLIYSDNGVAAVITPNESTDGGGGTDTGTDTGTATATGESIVRTGVGSVTLFWVLMLAVLGLVRSNYCRDGVV